jgi:hypothetical protein
MMYPAGSNSLVAIGEDGDAEIAQSSMIGRKHHSGWSSMLHREVSISRLPSKSAFTHQAEQAYTK